MMWKKKNFYMKNNFTFKKVLFCLFFICLILLPAKNLYAESFFALTSTETKYTQKTVDLELYFHLSSLEMIEKTLKNGSSVNIDYRATLYKERAFFPDQELEHYISGRQVRYDALTHEFILYHENKTPKKSRSLKDLLYQEFSYLNISLNLSNPLEESENYFVLLDLGLRHATIPPWLETTLFFWKWDIAGDSYHINLTSPK